MTDLIRCNGVQLELDAKWVEIEHRSPGANDTSVTSFVTHVGTIFNHVQLKFQLAFPQNPSIIMFFGLADILGLSESRT